MDRRAFFSRIVQAFSLLIVAVLSLPVIRFVVSQLSEEAAAGWYSIGSVRDLAGEEVRKVAFTRLIRDGWSIRLVEEYVWVRRTADANLIVFEPHCTHLGCAYDWKPDERQFHCPCHGGKFNAEGVKIDGPPPRPLDRYATKIENGLVKIGKVVRA